MPKLAAGQRAAAFSPHRPLLKWVCGAWLGLCLPAALADAPALAVAWQLVAPGVYVFWGAQEDSLPRNLGGIANAGLVVGERCAAVIDPGGSLALGLQLRQAMSAVTAKPVCAVINTHSHPDHVLGNAAFEQAGVRIHGHHQLPAQLAARGKAYVETAQRELGTDLAGSRLVAPTELVAADSWLDLGGRRLRLQALAKAHTNNDLTVWDETSDTLFAGDLLFVGRTPVVDGSVQGWLSVLEALARQHFAQVVPGHGPLLQRWPEGAQPHIKRLSDYLKRLQDGTRTAIARGLNLQQAMDSVAAENVEQWLLFEPYHRRNVAAVFTELEWE